MSISINNDMERRLGLWKVGFNEDGDMFCDQRFGDWPVRMDAKPFDKPDFMLLSYGCKASVSSGEGEDKITNECIRDWWRAAEPGEAWCCVDLGEVMDVNAVQINFADEGIDEDIPEDADRLVAHEIRYIDLEERVTRWVLEGSADGENWIVIEDKSEAETNLCNDFIMLDEAAELRYLRLTVLEMPFDQPATVCGIRVFGHGKGEAPAAATGVRAEKKGDIDMLVSWDADDAVGHNILWGYAPDKLYHSYMVLGRNEQNIGALMKGEPVFARVDAFNENGITEGTVFEV